VLIVRGLTFLGPEYKKQRKRMTVVQPQNALGYKSLNSGS